MKHFAALALLLLTFTIGASAQCTPDSSLTTPGFYPSPDSLPCVERTVAFDTVVQFRNFSTVNAQDFGIPFNVLVTVNWVRVDSIVGLPAGINYACNPNNCTFPGGSIGCINFNGTTNAPVGKYTLVIHATINADVPGFGTIEEQGTTNDLGYEIFLNVINAGDPCPLPSVELANGPVFSCPGQGAQILLDIDTGGAVAPFTYAWSPATGLSSSTVANPVATVTAATTYTVTVTDANGYDFTTTVLVDIDNTPAPVADFNFTVTGGNVVSFTNLSSNGNTLNWNFGNGNTSSSATPTQAFDSITDYTVTLIASNNCGSDTITKTVTITGITDLLGNPLILSVFPNPTCGTFTVSLNGSTVATQVMVYDMQGRVVSTAGLESHGGLMTTTIDLRSNGSGIYFVKVLSGNQVSTHKVVVQ